MDREYIYIVLGFSPPARNMRFSFAHIQIFAGVALLLLSQTALSHSAEFGTGPGVFPDTSDKVGDIMGFDADGNGRVDIALADHDGHIILFPRSAAGGYTSRTVINVAGYSGANGDIRSLVAIETKELAVDAMDGQHLDIALCSAPNSDHGNKKITILENRCPQYESVAENCFSAAYSRTITNKAHGCHWLEAVDVDDDGCTDLVVAERSHDKVAWYRNPACDPGLTQAELLAHWPKTVINGDGDCDKVERVAVAVGMNGPGSLAIAAVCNNPHKLRVYTRPALPADARTESEWSAQALADTGVHMKGLDVLDADGDGDLDFVTAGVGKVSWWENGPSWIEHVLPDSAVGVEYKTVVAFDADGDGDMDLAVGAHENSVGSVGWYENVDRLGTYSAQILTGSASFSVAVSVLDIDGDGDFDLLAGQFKDSTSQSYWYTNAHEEHCPSTYVLSACVRGLDGRFSNVDCEAYLQDGCFNACVAE